MHIVLCDDELIQTEFLSSLVLTYFEQKGCQCTITTFGSANALWWEFMAGMCCDLYLLDIQMEKMNGMELAHKIRESDQQTPIAFVTGVKDYVFDGYEVNAMAYLLKPYEKNQIGKLLDKFWREYQKKQLFTIIEIDKEMLRVCYDDILYMESQGHFTMMHLKAQNLNNLPLLLEIKKSINEMELAYYIYGFQRIHRCTIVNLHNVDRVLKHSCVLSNKEEVMIARGNYDKVMQAFIQVNYEVVK